MGAYSIVDILPVSTGLLLIGYSRFQIQYVIVKVHDDSDDYCIAKIYSRTLFHYMLLLIIGIIYQKMTSISTSQYTNFFWKNNHNSVHILLHISALYF